MVQNCAYWRLVSNGRGFLAEISVRLPRIFLFSLSTNIVVHSARQAFILANVAMAMNEFGLAAAFVNDRVKAVVQALAFYNVPRSLQERVVDSVQYYWAQHEGVNDEGLLPLLPERWGL